MQPERLRRLHPISTLFCDSSALTEPRQVSFLLNSEVYNRPNGNANSKLETLHNIFLVALSARALAFIDLMFPPQ